MKVRLTCLFVAIFSLALSLAQAQDVELRYIYLTFNVPPVEEQEAVQAALDELLAERGAGYTVQLDVLDSSTFGERMPLIIASGEAYDLVFTAPWTNNYANNVADGNFLAMDSLFEELPEFEASMPAAFWDVTRINGVPYAVVNQQWFPKPWGFMMTEETAAAYDVDPSTITSYEDLTPIMTEMQAQEGEGFFALAGSMPTLPETMGYDPVTQAVGSLAVAFDAEDPTIVNLYGTDEYLARMELIREWNELGLFTSDPITIDEARAGFVEGTVGVIFDQWRPSQVNSFRDNFDTTVVGNNIAPLILTTDAMIATMTAINVDSEHPVESAEFLTLLQTDTEVFNLIAYGVEGRNYELVDADAGVISLSDANPYNPGSWVFGNTFLGYATSAQDANLIQESIRVNDESQPSPILGFTFDPEPVQNELATMAAIEVEYGGLLVLGEEEDVAGTIADLIADLEAAGLQTVLDEANRQLDVWKAANE